MSDDLDELRKNVRRFLERYSTEEDVRRLMDDAQGYDPQVWQVMAEQLGLQGLIVPERYGGSGFGARELGIVLEEMGAALLASPFFATVVLAGNTLLSCGDDGAQERYLPSLASGELIATLAVSEDAGGWDDTAVRLRGVHTDAGWVLDGAKRYVLDAHISDLLLVVARTERGLSLFAVEPATASCAIEVETTLDATRKLSRVTFAGTPATLIGTEGEAWPGVRRALRLAAGALATEQVGVAQRVLDLTVAYGKVRHQFGRPVGSFQAVKHRLADMLVEVESARSAADDAVRAAAEDADDLELAASVAKAVCCDVAYRCAAQAIQLHGGIAFTWEHPAHLYFKRATSSQFLLGTSRHHRDLVGRAIGI